MNTFGDTRAAVFYARGTLELAIHWLYDAEQALDRPYKDDLSAMLFEPSLRAFVGPGLHAKMDVVRRQGNAAVHRTKPVTPAESLPPSPEGTALWQWRRRVRGTRSGSQRGCRC